MKPAIVQQIANAVLYEGYMLYPYRASAVKNKQRFNFGALHPEAWSNQNNDPYFMHTECLMEGQVGNEVEVTVRFLHLLSREVYDPAGSPVQFLEVDGRLIQSWQEAGEREVAFTARLRDVIQKPTSRLFCFRSAKDELPILDSAGRTAGTTVRRQERVQGKLDLSAEMLAEGLFKLSFRISNVTDLDDTCSNSRNEALMRSLVSTDAVLSSVDGQFVSLLDTPAELREYASKCKNIGNWPVLIGENGERGSMLASPIILYDYPQIAPESAGDLFDSTEIDEILTLRILTLTDEEKRQMRSLDDRGRSLLERAETLPMEQLMKMHGAVRGLKNAGEEKDLPAPWDPWEKKPERESVVIFGVAVRKGDRVRLRPVKSADILDLALQGQTAIIDSIEEDYDGKIHLAVLIDEDPGRDLGQLRQPGHRFFFSPEEVEPLPQEQTK